MPIIALTHSPSARLGDCELTHVDRQSIDLGRAMAQHEAYRSALEEADLQVRNFDFNACHADCCFVEDVAVVLEELVLVGSMGVASRRPEVAPWRDLLATFRPIVDLPADARLEGGDVLCLGKQLLIGLSARTNRKAIESVSDLVRPLGYSVHAIKVAGCLHLKTACTAIDDETLLLNPDWIEVGHLPQFKQIATCDSWGANILRINESLFASKTHTRTVEQLTENGFRVHVLDISEFEKAEAGLTCLSLLL